MLYAADLTRFKDNFKAAIEDACDDIPDLIAYLLSTEVERRIRRDLTRGYRHREQSLMRVRGRIDILTTESRQLLSKGEVYCRYEELTINTPRNRLVSAALELMARLVRNRDLSRHCRSLAATLRRSGVGGLRPSRAELATDQVGRNDAHDRFMVALAQLAFDLALPTEDAGATAFVASEREETWVRRLFEKAVLGFARFDFEAKGWSIRGGMALDWQPSFASSGLAAILPGMVTDIVIDRPDLNRRLVIDTKFTSILGTSRFSGASLKSGYIYQMYAYLRSQEGTDPRWDTASGLFLHPAVGSLLLENVTIQNHPITFATVDLAASATAIRNELRSLFQLSFSPPNSETKMV